MSSFLLNNLKNKDIFDEDGDIVNVKLFIAWHDEIPHSCFLEMDLDVEKCSQALIKQFGILPKSDQVRKLESSFHERDDEVFRMIHGRRGSSYTMFLKEKLLVEVKVDGISILYSSTINVTEIETVKQIASEHVVVKGKEKKKFHMIVNRGGDWELSEFEIKHTDVDLTQYYNDDFGYYHDRIVQSFSDKQQTGIVILHGMQGTGKTTYIRHLINTTALKFIYLPSYLANSLVDPGFLPFLTEHNNSVLIIEDCEQILMDREGGNTTAAIANILNMGDGLLGDALGMKIICTFNTPLSKIDKALTRRGRMIARYEFGELQREKAERLALKNKLSINHSKPLTLANIFGGLNEIESKVETHKMGFK